MNPSKHNAGSAAELLDGLNKAFARYVVFPSEQHLDAVTLWTATTHFVPAFEYAPRLVLRSPEKGSGKSRGLEIIADTCHNPLRAVNASIAAIFRSLEGEQPPTLLLDEADTIFGSRMVAEQNEDLRGLLNAGFQRGLPVLRTVGPQHETREFNTFAMAALAGIGKMPDTIEDRAIVVPMKRRKPSEKVSPYRIRRDRPGLNLLRDELSHWAQNSMGELAGIYPDMPLEDRAADTWEPLIMVADLAGGHWPTTARDAAVALTTEAATADTETSTNLQLLKDIDAIFQNVGSFIPSQELIDRLCDMEDSPWKDFDYTPAKLSYRLREYGIKTGFNTTKTARGYRIEDFQDTFERYTRPKASVAVQPLQTQVKLTDGLKTTDGLKASEENKASAQEPQDTNEKRVRTGTDGQHQGLDPKFGSRHCNKCGKSTPDNSGHLRICRHCDEPFDAELLGTIAGTDPTYGRIAYTKDGLAPSDPVAKQSWIQAGRPDLQFTESVA